MILVVIQGLDEQQDKWVFEMVEATHGNTTVFAQREELLQGEGH